MIDPAVKRWLKIARSDLKMAFLSLTYDDELTQQICFHSQQCVEKSLKGYLVFMNISFPKTHSIEYLYERCKEVNKDFSTINIGELSIYAVETRYPQEYSEPSIEEAKSAYKIARDVYSFIINELRAEESDLTLF